MACYYPIDGWRSSEPNENGKYPVLFSRNGSPLSDLVKIPCNNCIGCRLERSRQWAIRCTHEATQHDFNCFITLTYNEENIPDGHTLNKDHFQRFMKRFRKSIAPLKIRYLMAGEYGTDQDPTTTETIGRPHYHAIIFGYEFPMYKENLESTNTQGHKIYKSPFLENLWGMGNCMVGEFSYDTAAYVARYCVKKINGDLAETHYQRTNRTTGEITNIQPEYGTASNKPGLGYDWFQKFQSDLHKGFITINGSNHAPPKYYNQLLERYDEYTYEFVTAKKSQSIDALSPEYDAPRLQVKEHLRLKKTNSLKRALQ